MSTQEVMVPLKELNLNQLINVIHRLQDKIDQFYKKNDAEIRRENEALHRTVYTQFAVLEQIAEIMIAHGFTETTNQAIVHNFQRIMHRLREAEKQNKTA